VCTSMCVFSFKHRWRATTPTDPAGVRPPFARGLTFVVRPLARHKQPTGLVVSGLSLDELRQVRAGSVFGLGEEGPGELPNQAVQPGLRGAVALAVNSCAIRRPLVLPADGLHARPPKLGTRTASSRAPRLVGPEFCLPMVALRRWGTVGGLCACATDRFGATGSRQRMSLMGREHPWRSSQRTSAAPRKPILDLLRRPRYQAGTEGRPASAIASSASSYCWSTSLPLK